MERRWEVTSPRALTIIDATAEAIGDLHSRLCELEGEFDPTVTAAIRRASALLAQADEVLACAFTDAGGDESEASDVAGNRVE